MPSGTGGAKRRYEEASESQEERCIGYSVYIVDVRPGLVIGGKSLDLHADFATWYPDLWPGFMCPIRTIAAEGLFFVYIFFDRILNCLTHRNTRLKPFYFFLASSFVNIFGKIQHRKRII